MESFFDKIIKCWSTNEKRWNALKMQYDDKRVIPFVGAGMSVPIYPDWGQALKDVLNGTKKEKEKLENYLSKNQYEMASQYVRKTKGNGFFESLDDVFDPKKIIEHVNKKDEPASSLLPEVFRSGLLVTTNFDTVLEHYYKNENSFLNVITLSNLRDNKGLINKSVRENSHVLLKIHGDINDHDSLVFTKEQNNKVYGNEIFVKGLQKLIESKIFLFLGCSCIGENRYIKVFKKVMDEDKQNFAFLSLPKRKKKQIKEEYIDEVKKRDKELIDWGVFPIWYPYNKHESVKHLLQKLKEVITDSIENDLNTDQKIKKGMAEHKSQIRNETLLPWIKDSIYQKASLSFNALYPKLFITPKLNNLTTNNYKYSEIQELVQLNLNKNIVITGDAGIGKSTLLKYIYLYQENLVKGIKQAPVFYYLKATDYLSVSNKNQKENETNDEIIKNYFEHVKSILDDSGNISNNENSVILIDGIDEAYTDDYTELTQKIYNETNVHVWLGWRREHYNKNKTVDLKKKINEEILVNDWELKDAEEYVKKYSELIGNNKIYERFMLAVENENIAEFAKNPFQLTLLLFLMKNYRIKIGQTISYYSLYDRFINSWITKEIAKEEKEAGKKEKKEKEDDYKRIIKSLIEVSQKIYYKTETEGYLISSSRAVIRDLFHFTYGDYANEFCHRSLAAYFVAKNMIDLLIENNTESVLIDELKKPLNNDVTKFIRSALNDENVYSDKKIVNIQEKLQSLYYKVSSDEISNYKEDMEGYFRAKNEIVYLITRLRNVKENASKFIRNIYLKENDTRMKVTIAFGAAILGLQDIAKKYAEEYYLVDSELEKVTRSFSLVYYRDVSETNLYSYVDKGYEPWENSRKIRLKNLLSDEIKDKNFRILDIPLLYCFYKSREWKEVNKEDYDKFISKIKVDKEFYSKDVYDFLVDKIELLKKEYSEKLVNKNKK